MQEGRRSVAAKHLIGPASSLDTTLVGALPHDCGVPSCYHKI